MTQFLGNAFTVALSPQQHVNREGEEMIGGGVAFMGLLGADGAVDVWSAQEGLIGGETADEIFVIMEGKGEITFDDTGETIQMGPGDVVLLKHGQTNTWRTLETIRKVSFYLPSTAPGESGATMQQ